MCSVSSICGIPCFSGNQKYLLAFEFLEGLVCYTRGFLSQPHLMKMITIMYILCIKGGGWAVRQYKIYEKHFE